MTNKATQSRNNNINAERAMRSIIPLVAMHLIEGTNFKISSVTFHQDKYDDKFLCFRLVHYFWYLSDNPIDSKSGFPMQPASNGPQLIRHACSWEIETNFYQFASIKVENETFNVNSRLLCLIRCSLINCSHCSQHWSFVRCKVNAHNLLKAVWQFSFCS